MISSQVLETLELRNVNIEDFVKNENASGDLIDTSAVSFDLGLDIDLWLQVSSENGKIKNVKVRLCFRIICHAQTHYCII